MMVKFSMNIALEKKVTHTLGAKWTIEHTKNKF
jgi:hypothetical protein